MVITMITTAGLHIPAFYFAAVPASVQHDPSAYAFSIFGLLGSNLLAIEWLRQNVFRMIHAPRSLRHPVTLYRLSWILMMVGILMRSGPDVLQITLWPDVTPATRFGIAHWNRLLDGGSFVPMFIGFGIGAVTHRLDEAQIGREPIPTNLWPSRSDAYRIALAGLLLLFISVAIAFR